MFSVSLPLHRSLKSSHLWDSFQSWLPPWQLSISRCLETHQTWYSNKTSLNERHSFSVTSSSIPENAILGTPVPEQCRGTDFLCTLGCTPVIVVLQHFDLFLPNVFISILRTVLWKWKWVPSFCMCLYLYSLYSLYTELYGILCHLSIEIHTHTQGWLYVQIGMYTTFSGNNHQKENSRKID